MIGPGGEPVHVGCGDGFAVWYDGILWTLLLTGEQTGGRQAMIELLCPEVPCVAVHRHRQAHETLYVLEGEVTVTVDGRAAQVRAGERTSVPRMAGHSIDVTTPTARLLSIHTPAGFEEFILELGTPAVSRTLPLRLLPAPDPAQVAAAAKRHGVLLG